MLLLSLTGLWLLLALALAVRLGRAGSSKLTLTRIAEPLRVAPTLSIVVPMRNEARNIAACLEGLLTQRYDTESIEVIVVDDGSTDGSVAIARAVIVRLGAQERARVVSAGPLPPGWLGKANGCRRGAAEARGEWIAFVDADVQCGPALFDSAIGHAREARLDLLSLVPRQRFESFWERALLLPIFVLFGAALPLRGGSSTPIANGQFLLFRRASYDAVGGHSAVRAAMLDDYAFARTIRSHGLRGELLLAMNLFSCRMYTDLASVWNGMANNMVGFLGGSRAGAARSSVLFAMLGAGFVLLLPVDAWACANTPDTVLATSTAVLAAVGAVTVTSVIVGAVVALRAPLVTALVVPFGMIAQMGVLAASWHRDVRRTFRWRGREIRLDPHFRGMNPTATKAAEQESR